MKFYDMDILASKIGVTNKYLFTSLVATRARSMSDRKSRLIEDDKEKFISMVLDEMDTGGFNLSKNSASPVESQEEVTPDVTLEEES